MKIGIALKLFASASALLCTIGQAVASTEFYYTSSPQSWVGGGETVSVTPAMGFDFFASRNFDNGVSFAINDFASNHDFWSQRWWYLDLAAPFDAPLSIGKYRGATRWPFQADDAPGLDFSGNGRGNNMLTGSFRVREVSYAGDGSVLTFAADFVQYDEGFKAWWNAGSIRYNSSIPIPSVPEPSAVLLLCTGIGALVLLARRRRAV